MPGDLVPASSMVDLASTHVGDPYHLGVLVPKNNSKWRGPWDCAEFTSWLVYQTLGTLYGCQNDSSNPALADAWTGYWERDVKSIGELVSWQVASVTPGAFCLRYPPMPKVPGHIVLCVGDGTTIEAYDTAKGLIRNEINGRRWDAGVLVPGFSFTSGDLPAPTAPVNTLRLATPVMFGDDVAALQKALAAAGFDSGAPDGIFGPHTSAAVIAFQLSKGLIPDGEAGVLTFRALGM